MGEEKFERRVPRRSVNIHSFRALGKAARKKGKEKEKGAEGGGGARLGKLKSDGMTMDRRLSAKE